MQSRKNIVRPLSLWLSSLALASGWARVASAEPQLLAYHPPPYQFEIGPSLTYQTRSTDSSAGQNPSKIRYGASLSAGLFLRITFLPWLRAAARYRTGSHDVTLPAGSLGVTNGHVLSTQEGLEATQLDAYLQPTFSPVARLYVWANIGIGWGRLSMPPVIVDPQTPPPLVLRSRAGVFIETPLGVGVGYDLVPHLVTVSYDAMVEPIFLRQTGNMYDNDLYVDRHGDLQTVRAMPPLSHSVSQTISVALAL